MKFTEEKLEKAFTELLGQKLINFLKEITEYNIDIFIQNIKLFISGNFATKLRSYHYSLKFQNVQFFC